MIYDTNESREILRFEINNGGKSIMKLIEKFRFRVN